MGKNGTGTSIWRACSQRYGCLIVQKNEAAVTTHSIFFIRHCVDCGDYGGLVVGSAYTSYPVAVLTHMALEFSAPDWVRTVTKSPGTIEVETRLQVAVPGDVRGVAGEVIADAKPAHYSYGLPIFLALLLAARSKKMLRYAAAGYALLLPAQAFSLTFNLLKQMMVACQSNLATLDVAQWQLEGIAFCYQLGCVVVPTLVPVGLWLWLNKDFFARVLAPPWRQQSG